MKENNGVFRLKYQDLIVEKTDSVAKVILNRPNSLNTLSVRLLRELKEAVFDLYNTTGMKAVVLTGGPDIFSAGLDLKDAEVTRMLSGSMAERRQMAVSGSETGKSWEEAGPITIAAIEGYCLGGGVSLVMLRRPVRSTLAAVLKSLFAKGASFLI